MTAKQAGEWGWWSSRDEENYIGPFKTREAAVADLDGDWGFICEARTNPVPLSKWIDVDAMLDMANEALADEGMSDPDGDPVFDISTEQLADLRRRIKQACDEWQAINGLVFLPWAFSEMRNKARISPDDEREA